MSRPLAAPVRRAAPLRIAFPFLLVSFTVLAAALHWGDQWGARLLGREPWQFVAGPLGTVCNRDAQSMYLWPTTWSRYQDATRMMGQCGDSPLNPLLVWSHVLGAALFCVLAVVLYAVGPTWRIHRRGLIDLPDERLPELAEHLEELCRRSGVRTSFLLHPLDPTLSGAAFGTARRRYVQLNRGLLALHATDRARFDAVVLHELAHIRNRDLDITQFTVALWRVFTALAVTLSLYTLANAGPPRDWLWIAQSLYELLVVSGFVLLARNAVLRSREVHADLRVLEWQGTSEHLEGVLALGTATVGWPSRRWWRWRVHPAGRDRIGVVSGSRLAPEVGFGGGFLIGVAVILLDGLVASVVPWLTGYQYGTMSSAVPYVAFAAGGVVLAAWQAIEGTQGVGRIGVGLGVGLVAGATVLDAHTVLLPVAPLPDGSEALMLVLWAALSVLAAWAYVRWVAMCLRAWAAAAPYAAGYRWTLLVTWLASALVLDVWQQLMFRWIPQEALIARYVGLGPWASPPIALFVDIALNVLLFLPLPLTGAFLTALALHPLTAHAWQWGSARRKDAPRCDPAPLRIRQAVLIGVLAAAVVLALYFPGFLLIRHDAPDWASQGWWKWAYLGLRCVIPAAAAATAAALRHPLAVPRGMLAGLVAGLVGSPGITMVANTADCLASSQACHPLHGMTASASLSYVLFGLFPAALFAVASRLAVRRG
ncbi:M48 family metalloprotease [Streptantibioticus ferralitis]|uniref:M48 family metalloprotease n=1 Tax=Streptantibioticus ferralitis TaxID=236510 RepID=A0ABT5Z186_9ACTN|nr:M48 family metalloprotease [Streptantibioticus ferralitis]MDF2257402.1 M48 family metalloprotease [Streptantibioticus ferralitis]